MYCSWQHAAAKAQRELQERTPCEPQQRPEFALPAAGRYWVQGQLQLARCARTQHAEPGTYHGGGAGSDRVARHVGESRKVGACDRKVRRESVVRVLG
eukprot:288592-Prymnesium_polylepis.1